MIKRENKYYKYFFIIPLFIHLSVSAQMPDWKYYKDREGNEYFFDGAFKIRIADQPEFKYPPVSAAGIDYYLNTGIEYINSHNIPLGLYFLKSIMSLESSNMRVRKTQVESSKWINFLKKKHGGRYDLYDRESTLLITKKGKNYEIVNEKMFYRISTGSRPEIIKNRWKHSGTGYGLQAGIRGGNTSDSGYEFIIGIESMKFNYDIKSVESAEKIFRDEIGYDMIRRSEIEKSADFKIYSLEYPAGAPFYGYEAISENKKMIHMIRAVCHVNIKDSVRDRMISMVKSFRVVE